MSEVLLTQAQVAARLAVTTRTVQKIQAALIARGLKVVRIESRPRYVESSLDRVINRAAESGVPLAWGAK